jgi:hypothetical protein
MRINIFTKVGFYQINLDVLLEGRINNDKKLKRGYFCSCPWE